MYHQVGLMRGVSFGTMQSDIDFGSLRLNLMSDMKSSVSYISMSSLVHIAFLSSTFQYLKPKPQITSFRPIFGIFRRRQKQCDARKTSKYGV